MADQAYEEGSQRFVFQCSEWEWAHRYDGSKEQKNLGNAISGSKAVDFVAHGKKYILLLEVKDFCGHEKENLWRITGETDHAKKLGITLGPQDHALHHELALKVRDTLAGLVGAATHSQNRQSEYQRLICEAMKGDKELLILGSIAFADKSICVGSQKFDLNNEQLKALQDKLKKALKPWLRCTVLLINPEGAGQYAERGIRIERLP